MSLTRKARDIHNLMKNIVSLSDGQATIHHFDYESEAEEMIVRIVPNGGLYKDGTFDFRLEFSGYPSDAPSLTCLTKIYHPNIDFYSSEDNICLSLIDTDWTSTCTLEDVVQGILFLLYNPNLDDALSPWFGATTDYDEFKENVAKSLLGESVEDVDFDRNCCHESVPEKGLPPEHVSGAIMEDILTLVIYNTPGEKSYDVTQMNLLNLESRHKAETTFSEELGSDSMPRETTLITELLTDAAELPALNDCKNGSRKEDEKTKTEKPSESCALSESDLRNTTIVDGPVELCEKNSLLCCSRRPMTLLYCDNLAPEISLMSALLPNVVKYIYKSVNLRSKKSSNFS